MASACLGRRLTIYRRKVKMQLYKGKDVIDEISMFSTPRRLQMKRPSLLS